jgi:hypothetical protein
MGLLRSGSIRSAPVLEPVETSVRAPGRWEAQRRSEWLLLIPGHRVVLLPLALGSCAGTS